MLAVLLPFLKKFGPYIAAAMFFFIAGCFAGCRFEYGAVEAAKSSLLAQKENDAAAVAAANAAAATELAEVNTKADAAEAQVAAADVGAAAQETALTTRIAAQAAEAGQDASDAPVLAATLDDMAKGNP